MFADEQIVAVRTVSYSQKPKPNADRAQFAKNVARLRYKAKLTQEEFAEKAGLATRFIQRIEAGDSWPSLTNLNALRQTLGCSWNELLNGVGFNSLPDKND